MGRCRSLAGVCVLVVTLAAAGCSENSDTAASRAPVPGQYQSLYSTIGTQLSEAQATVDGLAARTDPKMLYGAILLFADGNRGTQLLLPQTMSQVDEELNVLAKMGVGDVSLAVNFPLLLPTTSDSAQYLDFYEKVAHAVRQHRMLLSVEENPILAGTPFALSAKVSYAGLTDTTYAQEQAEQAQLIVDDLHPAYLSLMTEPTTDATYIGLPGLNQPTTSAAVVEQEVEAIHRGSTLLGAGAGSWSSPQFDKDYATTGVDYIDLHVYPTEPQFVTNAIADANEARAAHLPMIMDEFYLFPSLNFNGQGTIDKHEIEPFTWMDPLETKFLKIFTTFAVREDFALVVAFDDNTFIANLTWQSGDNTDNLQSVNALYDPVLVRALAAGRLSAVGRSYKEMIRTHT
jgi:hypothetical protein